MQYYNNPYYISPEYSMDYSNNPFYPGYMDAIPPQNPYMPPVQNPYMPPQNPYMVPQEPILSPNDPYTYPQNLMPALELIRNAIAGEAEDRAFYDYLISIAPDQEDKDILTGIRDDEIKHAGLFRQIYRELTAQMPPTQGKGEGEFTKPASYCEGIKKAMLGELAAVERYRRILFAMQDRRHINMLTEIITDELRHGNLYNLLYSKNECFREEETTEKMKG